MPSSTSSSEPRRIPGGRWGATWLVALALAAAATWRLEALTRAGGQRPSVIDDTFLWSLSRLEVDGDPGLAVFLGASRMAVGYAPDAFAESAPALRSLQLSISDNLPLTVLADLAADEEFRGVAVVDLIEHEIADPLLLTDSQAWVDRSRELWRAPGALANRYLASHVQAQLAVLAVGGRRIITSAGRWRWPAPSWVAIERDRTARGDYSLAEPAALRSKAERRLDGFPPSPPAEAWLAVLEQHFEPLVRRIRARGGAVVLVHMPVSGRLADKLDEVYPRARYWDAHAARSSAHVIHFRDLPAMAGLVCPDEMHLDQRDQRAFMRALVEAMRARGVLTGRARSPLM